MSGLAESRRRCLAIAIADAFLDGEWQRDAMIARADEAVPGHTHHLRRLARRALLAFPVAPRDRASELAALMLRLARWGNPAYHEFRYSPGDRRPWPNRSRRYFLPSPEPAPRVIDWGTPALATVADLAAWLDVEPGRLDWLADRRGLERRAAPSLRRYDYQWRRKRGGYRLVEAPRPLLASVQRQIHEEVLARVPIHDAAHGFRAGRSILTNAAPHVAAPSLLRLDLVEFFASISRARVFAIFRAAGYPEGVARVLAALTTNRAPLAIARHHHRLLDPHLPTGAPTSPALANLAAFRLDLRLAHAAASAGLRYTRYADDLAFSGDLSIARLRRFALLVGGIALDEGFTLNHRKTRIQPASARQTVAGVVVNRHAALARDERDRLRAFLHNCVRHGPSSQNREGLLDLRAHLAGRIAHVRHLHAAHARRLDELFTAIDWTR